MNVLHLESFMPLSLNYLKSNAFADVACVLLWIQYVGCLLVKISVQCIVGFLSGPLIGFHVQKRTVLSASARCRITLLNIIIPLVAFTSYFELRIKKICVEHHFNPYTEKQPCAQQT